MMRRLPVLFVIAILSLPAGVRAQSPAPDDPAVAPRDLLVAPDSAASVPAARDTFPRIVRLPEIVVSTARPGGNAPVARSVLTRAQLVDRNTGQDTPMLLGTLPGAYAYSDAGNGIGYSYLAIRGFPQRRISVLINGVPLNDPQEHEVYWIDHPDLLASSAAVEVQRGVGSALYGAASLGGSVNIDLPAFFETPQTNVDVAYGSYDTKRLMFETGSGALPGGWNLYGRYSRIETLGYRQQSWSKLWAYTFGARRVWGDQSLRIDLYGGPEETHLAYLSVAPEFLLGQVTGNVDRDRTFNPLTYPNERDHFFEPHYDVVHSWTPVTRVTLSQTLFWFDGKGYYDEQRGAQALADYRLQPWTTTDSTLVPRSYYQTDTTGALTQDAQGRFTVTTADLVRRRSVVNRNFGWIPRVRWAHAGGALTLGAELQGADGHHYGEVIQGNGLPPGTPPNQTYYDFHPHTFAAGLFAREEWNVGPGLTATGDMAWRHQSYRFEADRFDGVRFDQAYDFAIPRAGLTWTPRADVRAFAAWSHSSREPALRDLYDGEELGGLPLYQVADVATNTYRGALIHPETVEDFELGAAWGAAPAQLTATVYRMNFRNELVDAGQFNTDLGYPVIGNAAKSVHQGVELAAHAERRLPGGSRLALDGNASLADNHFVRYREVDGTAPGDTVSFDGKTIGFFPEVLGNFRARWSWRAVSLGGDLQQVGRQYLDNTATRSASIAPHTVLNLEGGLQLHVAGSAMELRGHVYNVTNRAYETGGYMDYDASGALVPFRTPAAKRNVFVELRMGLQ